jgi:hypothetical protein
MCKELVDGAFDQLERSAAATLVYLTWLEIRAEIELEQARALSDPLFPSLVDTDQSLARHLRLLTAKHRSSELLAKLRLARENSARRQSPAANHAPSAFFDNPLGPRRSVPSVPSDAARESRPSSAGGSRTARPADATAAARSARRSNSAVRSTARQDGSAQRVVEKRARRRAPADRGSGREDPPA